MIEKIHGTMGDILINSAYVEKRINPDLPNARQILTNEYGALSLVVREKVLKDPELDEPIDIILYMIIAALGFATVENVLVLFLLEKPFLIGEVSFITAFRFVGATFLHALASGTIGYFLVRYFSHTSQKIFISGFLFAILLHGFFNFSIIMADEGKITRQAGFISVALILIFLAGFLNISFKKVKKLPSVCYIK
mgnify:CR=1 FL=1